MNNTLYAAIRNYPYADFFREVQYNGATLSDSERREFVAVADETVASFAEGLPMIYDRIEGIKELHDEYNTLYRELLFCMQFVLITMIDSIVASKYFLIANREYDRRFMRGKLSVILNEGFKRLYGFDEKIRRKTEWGKLKAIIDKSPKEIQQQYAKLSALLENCANTSTWWKEERNVETHLDAEKLYVSRCKDVIGSKVMMDSLKLFNVLFAVDCFLTNLHGCFNNFLAEKYYRGELKEE